MKISFTKQYGGTLTPASDIEAERMSRFKTGEIYEIDIKLPRNGAFHGKVFTFLDFCFKFWRSGQEFQCDRAQFTAFRNKLTILAGYYDDVVDMETMKLTVVAKSLSYDNMTQEEFEQCYSAMINAAIKHIDFGTSKDIEDRLLSFF